MVDEKRLQELMTQKREIEREIHRLKGVPVITDNAKLEKKSDHWVISINKRTDFSCSRRRDKTFVGIATFINRGEAVKIVDTYIGYLEELRHDIDLDDKMMLNAELKTCIEKE